MSNKLLCNQRRINCAKLMLAVYVTAAPVVQTQTPVVSTSSSSTPYTEASQMAAGRTGEYRIGPGDLLSIQFFARGQSSAETRLSRDELVDHHGMIRMPLIDGDIQAACRTENELADELGRMYRDRQLLRNPIIFVSVKDYQSQFVAVMGAVNAGGKFILRRRVSLLELVNFHAGGLTPKAGKKIQILSTGAVVTCNGSSVQNVAENSAMTSESGEVVTYDLTQLNPTGPYVKPGDIINIPAAEEALIVGSVVRPSSIPLLEPTTLARAIATVGGTLPNTDKEKIRITRQIPGSSATTEMFVDLKNKDKGKGEGFLLQGGDIVEVSSKTGFTTFMKHLATTTLVPMATSIPARIIY